MRFKMEITVDKERICPLLDVTDPEFRKLRQAILKRGYAIDADKHQNVLRVFSEGLGESEKLLMHSRIKEIIQTLKLKRSN